MCDGVYHGRAAKLNGQGGGEIKACNLIPYAPVVRATKNRLPLSRQTATEVYYLECVPQLVCQRQSYGENEVYKQLNECLQ